MDFQNVSSSIRSLTIERGRTPAGRALIDTARVPPRGVLELTKQDLEKLLEGDKPGADSAARARLALFLADFRRGAPQQPVTARVRFAADKGAVRGGTMAEAIARAMAPQQEQPVPSREIEGSGDIQLGPEAAFHARDPSTLIVPQDPDAPRAPRVEIASVIPGIGPDAGRFDLADLRDASRRASVSPETEAAIAAAGVTEAAPGSGGVPSSPAAAQEPAAAATVAAPDPARVIVAGQPAGPAGRPPRASSSSGKGS